MAPTSRNDDESEVAPAGIDRPDLLLVAVLFGLGVIGLVALGFVGISALGMWSSDVAIGALVAGLFVFAPASLAFLYMAEEARRALHQTRRQVAQATEAIRAQQPPRKELEGLTASYRELVQVQKDQATTHTFQEQAQDRMEASHERQEAKLLDIESLLEATVKKDEIEFLLREQGRPLGPPSGSHAPSSRQQGDVASHSNGDDQPATYRLEHLPGVPKEDVRLLERHGVETTYTLLFAEVDELSEDTGISEDRLRAWRDKAELTVMIEGVGPRLLDPLARAGITDLEALSDQDPDRLQQAIEEHLQETERVPGAEQLVNQARQFVPSREPRATP